MQSAHYRITTEADGSRRLCTFGSMSNGKDFPVTLLELDESYSVVSFFDMPPRHETCTVKLFIYRRVPEV